MCGEGSSVSSNVGRIWTIVMEDSGLSKSGKRRR